MDIHYRLNTDFPAVHGRASETAYFQGTPSNVDVSG